MYISYTGYKTEKEAEDALELIAKNKDRYINALTMMEHMQKMNLEDCK